MKRLNRTEINRRRFMRAAFVTELKPEKTFPKFMRYALFVCVALFIVYVITLAVEGL